MGSVNLREVEPGWRAKMKGTHWEGEMPEVTGKVLECLKPIKPKDSPTFQPDRFMFRLPKNVKGGKIVVFSAEDVETWLPPETVSSNNR
jgi:hypothetical protein